MKGNFKYGYLCDIKLRTIFVIRSSLPNKNSDTFLLDPTLNPGKPLAFPDVPFSDKQEKVITANTGTGSMNVHKDAEKRGDEIGWLLSVEEPTNW